MNLRILSVNIARARDIGTFEGERVISGIDKRGVASDAVQVRRLGIVGDEQADLTVHGGVDKAVYAYPSEHWPWWEGEHRIASGPATFGENLTLEGADESAVAIGDRFRWGSALLEISQPRAPCYKLGMHAGRAEAPQIMTVSARCGWYLRVIEEGDAPSRDAALERVRESGAPSVRDVFRALFGRHADETTLSRICDVPELAESWRRPLRVKIAQIQARQH
ncbi:MAG: MOSC domain-containing protein [Alphaproteobacteria bacterium]|nr:MOSC domain-containing protein [Alphaproteobacteria bacterium]